MLSTTKTNKKKRETSFFFLSVFLVAFLVESVFSFLFFLLSCFLFVNAHQNILTDFPARQRIFDISILSRDMESGKSSYAYTLKCKLPPYREIQTKYSGSPDIGRLMIIFLLMIIKTLRPGVMTKSDGEANIGRGATVLRPPLFGTFC